MLQWTWGCRYFFKLMFLFFGCIPRSGVAWSCDSYIFNFLRNFCTVFHSGCTNLHSHQQCRVLFSPYPYQYLLFLVLLRITIVTGVKCSFIVFHCPFDLHFTGDWCGTSFHVSFRPSVCLWKSGYLDLLILKLFFCLSCYEFFIYFGY